MSKGSIPLILLILFLLLQGCGTSRRFGTTIVRDENNPCIVHMIVQVAIQGTDEDFNRVKSELEDCFNRECFIPCPTDSTKGCKAMVSVTVKKYGELKEEERSAYHYVQMVDNDGLPSWAQLGRPNSDAVDGQWRRDAPAGTYCHEVLHFCGLEDKYCARIYDPVKDSIIVERSCDPPPDPFGNCCTPGAGFKRCTWPCAGHDDNIMGSGWASMKCDNILHVLRNAGYGECPDACCGSDSTFSAPAAEVYITPGYYHFGEKNNKLGTFGIGIGGTKYLGSSLGVTIEGGMYFHSEENQEVKETVRMSHLMGGVSYRPKTKSGSRLNFVARLLAGISEYRQTTRIPNFEDNESKYHSLVLNIGGSANLWLNRKMDLRLLQVDYMPTFFFDETQHNFRVSTGLVWKFGGR